MTIPARGRVAGSDRASWWWPGAAAVAYLTGRDLAVGGRRGPRPGHGSACRAAPAGLIATTSRNLDRTGVAAAGNLLRAGLLSEVEEMSETAELREMTEGVEEESTASSCR